MNTALCEPAAPPRRRRLRLVHGLLAVLLAYLLYGWWGAARSTRGLVEIAASARRRVVAARAEAEREGRPEDYLRELARRQEQAWLDSEPPDDPRLRAAWARIEGAWDLVSLADPDQPSTFGPDTLPTPVRRTFAAGVMTERGRHAPTAPTLYTHTHHYALDPDRSPMAIDESTGRLAPPVARGLWKVEGDTLTLSLSRTAERPTTFEPGPGRRVLVFRRADPKTSP